MCLSVRYPLLSTADSRQDEERRKGHVCFSILYRWLSTVDSRQDEEKVMCVWLFKKK